ncbi:SAV_915 family protein [Streptomyces sp. NPDC049541]|uniref:SAV_915 family protein n=1 Tax=Streptomyces sp. NPDC049541 TaxID=3365594 RepID=UPI0037B86D12
MTRVTANKLVIAPARPVMRDGEQEILFEAKPDMSGQMVGIAFTSIERLVEVMGDSQPWVCLPISSLKEFHEQSGIHRIVVDARFMQQGEE